MVWFGEDYKIFLDLIFRANLKCYTEHVHLYQCNWSHSRWKYLDRQVRTAYWRSFHLIDPSWPKTMLSRFLVPIFSCWAEMALMIRTALQKATLIVRRLFQMNFFRGGQFRGVMRNLPRIGPVDENHAVFRDRSMFEFPEGTKAATFGMGCFWGVERLFWNLNPKIYTTQGQCQKFASLVIG